MFLTGTDMDLIRRFVEVPEDFHAPLDTAGVVIVGRAIAERHRRRAHRVSLELPEGPVSASGTELVTKLRRQADEDADSARRWRAVAETILRHDR